MAKQQPAPAASSPLATHGDLTRLLGEVDDVKAAEILGLKPRLVEVEQAAVWAAGEGDRLARKGHELVGVVARIVDILALDEDEEEERSPPAGG
jgi:hypothetical protein